MLTVQGSDDLRATIREWKKAGQRIGFVPTMGNLHNGHFSLISIARAHADRVVASVFVNPTQFGPHEDFASYPRTLAQDQSGLESAGCDLLFAPSVDEMYPFGAANMVRVEVPGLSETLDGALRPGHFSGVATVVTRLFNLVQPRVAFFGEKDYQQLVVIKKMVHDLQMPVEIVGVETVREKDGLACSSRNIFLDSEQRQTAPKLQETLQEIRKKSLLAPDSLAKFLDEGKRKLSELRDVDLKYLVACDADTLEELTTTKLPMVLLVAAKFREVWLIDTLVVRK